MVEMDAMDVKIFCEMASRDLNYSSFTERQVSPSAIGRKLGLDEKTVRVRIRTMENGGFIKYYQGLPNLSLFGLKSLCSYRLTALNVSTKRKLLDEVQQKNGIVEASDYLGSTISVAIAASSEEEAQTLVDALSRRFELTSLLQGERKVKEPAAKLDKLDWQIIRKLRYDARGSVKDLAHALHITSRMSEYRIGKLLKSGILSIRAIIDPQKQEGLIFYELEAAVEKTKQAKAIGHFREGFGEKLWSVAMSPAGVFILNLFAFSLHDPEEVATSLLQIEGVRGCSLFILKEAIEPARPNWIDRLIEKRIADFG